MCLCVFPILFLALWSRISSFELIFFSSRSFVVRFYPSSVSLFSTFPVFPLVQMYFVIRISNKLHSFSRSLSLVLAFTFSIFHSIFLLQFFRPVHINRIVMRKKRASSNAHINKRMREIIQSCSLCVRVRIVRRAEKSVF